MSLSFLSLSLNSLEARRRASFRLAPPSHSFCIHAPIFASLAKCFLRRLVRPRKTIKRGAVSQASSWAWLCGVTGGSGSNRAASLRRMRIDRGASANRRRTRALRACRSSSPERYTKSFFASWRPRSRCCANVWSFSYAAGLTTRPGARPLRLPRAWEPCCRTSPTPP
jgi:hypothetical protein